LLNIDPLPPCDFPPDFGFCGAILKTVFDEVGYPEKKRPGCLLPAEIDSIKFALDVRKQLTVGPVYQIRFPEGGRNY
jgi:hypothetical protein